MNPDSIFTIKRQHIYFNKYKKIVEQKGGIMISTISDYNNAHSKLRIKCSNNHEFECTLNNLSKNEWCSKCKLKINEMVTLCALEHLFEKKFIKIRPNWLKNNDGNNLEIDCFNEELKLCVEYNGIQHYKYIEYFHRTYDNFIKRHEFDKIKKNKCIDKGYIFIDIPYYIIIENIINYISEKCIENNIKFDTERIKTFDYNKIYFSNKKHDDLLKIIKQKNGELISGTFILNSSIITLKCYKNHIWSAKAGKIKYNSWCPICSHEISDDSKKSISIGMILYNQTNEGIKMKKESHDKRSITMEKQREEIRKNLIDKNCTKCKNKKIISDFCKKTDTKDGYSSYCKLCITLFKKERKLKINNII
jgi:hypothetical protein